MDSQLGDLVAAKMASAEHQVGFNMLLYFTIDDLKVFIIITGQGDATSNGASQRQEHASKEVNNCKSIVCKNS